MSSQKIIVKRRTVIQSIIYHVQFLFGSYKCQEVYRDVDLRAEILNFGVDNTK